MMGHRIGEMTFDYMFNPRSIAIVGASNDAHNAATNMFLDSMLAFGYKGKLYPVNPKEKEVRGLKAYPSVRDIPGPVDHVISAIPATMILQLLDDCKAKDVKTLHLYTAGFA
jgi:acyl-CoA synthetase (NDP forming)